MSKLERAAPRFRDVVWRLRGLGAWRTGAAALSGPGIALLLSNAGPAVGLGAGALAAVACLALLPDPQARHGAAGGPPRQSGTGDGLGAYPLLEALPDPILLIDGMQQIVHANGAAARAFGSLAVGEALALRFRSPDFLAAVEAAVEAGEPTKAGITEGRTAGRVWAVDLEPVPSAAADERARRFLLVFKDRTAERRIERMRTDFVANASHELRTPLASLIGFIETLQGPARDDAAVRDRFLTIMREQAARMSRLIDDLLSLSQIEMKRPPAPGRTVDLAELFDDIRRTMAPVIADSGMEAEFAVKPGRYVVAGERDELLQVFSNLVENACKYAAGGRRLVLSLEEGRPTAGSIRASVRDFGPGIAAEHVPRLTERFYRVDVESSRAKRGTGLGLSIVRNILQRHSARLVVDSEVGKGSTFSVVFAASKDASS